MKLHGSKTGLSIALVAILAGGGGASRRPTGSQGGSRRPGPGDHPRDRRGGSERDGHSSRRDAPEHRPLPHIRRLEQAAVGGPQGAALKSIDALLAEYRSQKHR